MYPSIRKKSSTHIPYGEVQFRNTLDIFSYSHPEKYEIRSFVPLCNSDHCTIFSFLLLSRLWNGIFIHKITRCVHLQRFYWKLCFHFANARTRIFRILLTFFPLRTVKLMKWDRLYFSVNRIITLPFSHPFRTSVFEEFLL